MLHRLPSEVVSSFEMGLDPSLPAPHVPGKHGRCGMSEDFDFSAYLNDEIARSERILQ